MKFAIGTAVVIQQTGQKGTIIGRAEYNGVYPNSYWVQYQSGEGNLTKSWFDERDLA